MRILLLERGESVRRSGVNGTEAPPVICPPVSARPPSGAQYSR